MKRFFNTNVAIIALCTSIFSYNVEAADIHSGDYLASHFAQTNNDWENAHKYISSLINTENVPLNTLQRAMILAMGSGNPNSALEIANRIKSENPDIKDTVTEFFIIAESFKNKDYKKTLELLNNLPNDGTVNFVRPFIQGWLDAAQGVINIKDLQENTAQLYHGILISDFLGEHEEIETLIDKSLKSEHITTNDLHQIANIYGHIGNKSKAINIYKMILESDPDNTKITKSIKDIEQGTNHQLFNKLVSANSGMSKAFLDIASILYNEGNSESSRIFAHISLYIDPDMEGTKLLLAKLDSDNKQYKEAISHYNSIPKSDDRYITAQHRIVDIYELTGEFDKALDLLKEISVKHNEAETMIKIGDIYRNKENFKMALEFYDKAVEKIGGTVTADYWHLHYVRGIAYEQNDDWKRAEAELKAALTFQPDHPYILNYLGYAWADKGVNLQESLEMIKRAVDLQPSDGYITDSLGWAMYRVEDYENAVPVLERAVELMPYDPTINDHLGDAYWQVGRSLEANFQWQRAKNHSKDAVKVKELEQKITTGLVE